MAICFEGYIIQFSPKDYESRHQILSGHGRGLHMPPPPKESCNNKSLVWKWANMPLCVLWVSQRFLQKQVKLSPCNLLSTPITPYVAPAFEYHFQACLGLANSVSVYVYIRFGRVYIYGYFRIYTSISTVLRMGERPFEVTFRSDLRLGCK